MDVRSCEAQGPLPRGVYTSWGPGINAFALLKGARLEKCAFLLTSTYMEVASLHRK
jgi:hypothetical protein